MLSVMLTQNYIFRNLNKFGNKIDYTAMRRKSVQDNGVFNTVTIMNLNLMTKLRRSIKSQQNTIYFNASIMMMIVRQYSLNIDIDNIII